MPAAYTKSFQELTANQQTMEQELDSAERFIGYFCTYTPVELIHAAGFTPVRISGGPGTVEKAYAHVPDFICPYMKRALEKALEGRYAFLSGVVQAYTCDLACGMLEIWRKAIGGGLYHSLPLPYNDRPASRAFFNAGVHRLIEALQKAGGHFTEDRLEKSMALYGGIRNRLLELHRRLHAGTLALSAGELFSVTEAGNRLRPEKYLALLDQLVSEMPGSAEAEPYGIPVLISGSLLEAADIFDAIGKSGGRVVADDFCNGYRQLIPPAGEGASPVDQLVDRYTKRMSCPSRSRAEHRGLELIDLLSRSGARGVILVVQKFCTPHLSDYPILSDILKSEGYPVMMVEMDEAWSGGGQLATRLAGYFETLEA